MTLYKLCCAVVMWMIRLKKKKDISVHVTWIYMTVYTCTSHYICHLYIASYVSHICRHICICAVTFYIHWAHIECAIPPRMSQHIYKYVYTYVMHMMRYRCDRYSVMYMCIQSCKVISHIWLYMTTVTNTRTY